MPLSISSGEEYSLFLLVMSTASPVHSLNNEELNVLRHVRSAMSLGMRPSEGTMTCSVFEKGSMNLYPRQIGVQSIPTGEGWRWNQTKKRKEHVEETGTQTVIIKLIPRKLKNSKENAPRHKLWHVSFTSTSSSSISTVLFCERGAEPRPSTSLSSSSLYCSNTALEGDWLLDQNPKGTPESKMAFSFLCNSSPSPPPSASNSRLSHSPNK